jgi:hypothetical protein
MLLKIGIFECEVDRRDKKFLEFLLKWQKAMKEAEARNEEAEARNRALMRQRILLRQRQRMELN